MKRHLHVFLLGALVLAFVFDAIVWAAAARLPAIGRPLELSAKREAPLTYLYMFAGTPLVAIPPVADWGYAYATEAFSLVATEIELKPELAMEIAHGAAKQPRHSTLKLAHYAPVVLLVLWLIVYLRRPRPVHLNLRR